MKRRSEYSLDDKAFNQGYSDEIHDNTGQARDMKIRILQKNDKIESEEINETIN